MYIIISDRDRRICQVKRPSYSRDRSNHVYNVDAFARWPGRTTATVNPNYSSKFLVVYYRYIADSFGRPCSPMHLCENKRDRNNKAGNRSKILTTSSTSSFPAKSQLRSTLPKLTHSIPVLISMGLSEFWKCALQVWVSSKRFNSHTLLVYKTSETMNLL